MGKLSGRTVGGTLGFAPEGAGNCHQRLQCAAYRLLLDLRRAFADQPPGPRVRRTQVLRIGRSCRRCSHSGEYQGADSGVGSLAQTGGGCTRWDGERRGPRCDDGPRVRLTNADKVLYPATGTTRPTSSGYCTIADVMLPHHRRSAGHPQAVAQRCRPARVLRKAVGQFGPDWLDRHRRAPIRVARPIRSSIARPAGLDRPAGRAGSACAAMAIHGGRKARSGNAIGVRPRSGRGRDNAAACARWPVRCAT